MAETSAVCQF